MTSADPGQVSCELLTELVESAPDGMLAVDAEGRILLVNRQIELLLGYRRDELLGRPVELLLPQRFRATHVEHRTTFLEKPELRPMGAGAALPVLRKDGTETFIDLSLAPLTEAGPAAVAVVLRDATARVRAQAELERLALHDGLTGLPNRALLTDRLTGALARRVRAGAHVGLMFLDVDRLKWVNDTLGHAAGDTLLTAVARRVEGVLRPADTVARVGGDEFVVLVDEVPGVEELRELADRTLAAVRAPLRLGHRELQPSVSVGLALGRPGQVEAPALIREADAAMYQAKRNGRDRFELFQVEQHPEGGNDLELYAELRGAIDTGAVEVVYQPVIDLRDGSTWGVEALIRWTSPTVGEVEPSRIISLAERSSLILELDALVIDRACAFVAACELPTPLRLGVNISTRHLSAGGLPGVVQRALRRSGLAPGALWLELTETEALASADVTHQLRELLDLGVCVAIDDFGKGFSSLSRLRDLPFSLIKLDSAFVVGVEGDYKAQAMLAAVVSLAGALGVTLVVEGVETEAQRATLARLGCAYAQGYHLVGPLSAEALRSFLTADGRPVACTGA